MAVKKFTMFAAQAMGLAEIFQGVFSAGLEGPVHYKVELSAPDGPSTAGGKLAMQHIKLVPADGGATILMGSANPVEKQVELRTHAYLANQHAQRWKGAQLPIDKEKYAALVKQLQFFFTDQGMTVVMVDVSPQAQAPEPPQPTQPAVSPVVWVVLGIGVVAAAALAAFLALR